MESQFLGNLELFWTKKICGFYNKYYWWYSMRLHHPRTAENTEICRNLLVVGDASSSI